MPELKRPLEPSDSNALVVAKRPRNELVEVRDRNKAVVESVSIRFKPMYELNVYGLDLTLINQMIF